MAKLNPKPQPKGELKLYQIIEQQTNGWNLPDDTSDNLTKEQCDKKLEELYSAGISPARLKVKRVK
tara:strand:+ start:795 stop:992 length:198 start_codon:yes stop_codon:yes gene_type:complete